MVETKYGKYFITDPLIIKGEDVKYRLYGQGSKYDFEGMKNYWLRWNCITQPRSREKPHVHDFDEIFHFYGADASDITDFGAEVDLFVEGEKHTITCPTIVYMPAGTWHCPLNFRVVNKPVIFMNLAFTKEYEKTMESGEKIKIRHNV